MKEFLKQKIPSNEEGIFYIDGLVSTGNKFPDTILIIISTIQKLFTKNFINKRNLYLWISLRDYKLRGYFISDNIPDANNK
jgi:hypothetical protein